jgi:hypothetical protein
MTVTKAPGARRSRQWRLSHLTRAVARSLASAPEDQGSQSFKSRGETVDFDRVRWTPKTGQAAKRECPFGRPDGRR